MGGKTTPQTQTTTQTLSPQQQELLNLSMPGLRQYAATTPQRYQGETVAGFTPGQVAGQTSATSAAGTQADIAGSAADTLGTVLSGGSRSALPTPDLPTDPGLPTRPTASTIALPGRPIDAQPDLPSAPLGNDIWNPTSNPILQNATAAAVRPIYQNLTESVLPAIRGEAETTGNFGGSRQGIAEGIASRGASQAAGDTTAKLAQATYGTNIGAIEDQYKTALSGGLQKYSTDVGAGTQRYGTDVGAALQKYGTDVGAGTQLYGTDVGAGTQRFGTETGAASNVYNTAVQAAQRGDQQTADTMLKALGLTPSIQGAQTAPATTMSGVGDVQQNLAQQLINSKIAGFNFDQMAPFLASKDIASIVGGMPGGSTTAIASGPKTNPFTSALGGAASGAAMGSAFGPWGTGIGAVAGGVLPFLMNRG